MVVPVTPEVCCFHPSVIQEASGDPVSLVNELSSLWCSAPSAGDTHPLSFPVHLGVRWESTECSQRPLCLSREQGGDGLATCWDALGRGRSCLNVGRRAPGFIFHALFLKFIYLFIGCAESSLLHASFLLSQHTGSVALWHVESSQTRKIHVPCVGRWIVNHWTTKDVPTLFLNTLFLMSYTFSLVAWLSFSC